MERRANIYGRKAPRFSEIIGNLTVIDGLIHADIERLLPRRRMIDCREDRTHEIFDVDKIPLDRLTIRIKHHWHGLRADILVGLRGSHQITPARPAKHIVTEG